MTESLSETSKVTLGREVSSLDISTQFNAYSGVEIIVTEEITYFAGNRAGRVLSIQNPWGTQAQATAILNALTAKGFQYQPYTAEGAILNPAAEIGDGITISDTYSGLYKIDRKYSPLMSADVQAPQDEELDHEYPYEPKQDRIYKREIAEANAQIGLTVDAITAEVSRATTAEDSKLDHTHDASSFSWDLTASGFSLKSNGRTEVFKCTSSGIEIKGNATVTGRIQAISGFIGSSAANGFTITSSAIYNGKTSRMDANNGIYIGKDGIALGANSAFAVTNDGAVTAKNLNIQGGSINLGNGVFVVNPSGDVTATNLTITGGSIKIGSNFSVTSAGNVTANNMKLTGTLTVGGSTITADKLRQGASDGYSWGSGGGSYGGYASRAAYALGGAGGGINFNKAIDQSSGYVPAWFSAQRLHASSRVSAPEVTIESYPSQVNLSGHSHSISVSGGRVTFGSPTNGSQSFNIADTQYYKDGVSAAYNDGYNYGYSIGGSTVTLSYLEYTWHTSTGAGYHIVLTNGREIYGSSRF